jgi:hypothetical protein
MKKLLVVLVLVLAVATAANARLTLVSSAGTSLLPSMTTNIGVYNNVSEPSAMVAVVIVSGGASWTGANHVYSPPSTPGGVNTYYGVLEGIGDTWLSNLAAVPTVNPAGIGLQSDFTLHCDGPQSVHVVLLADDLSTVLDTMTIVQPEPMTLSLLGLGGLFLRRRSA